MKARLTFLVLLFSMLFINQSIFAQDQPQKTPTRKVTPANDKLVVLWTSGYAEVAKKMVYMYTYNAKKNGWWDKITFIIWGPSSKLLAEDKELQDYLKKMKDEGVVLEACKACADMYHVSDKLTELGVDVKYMGQDLTNYIKNEKYIITF